MIPSFNDKGTLVWRICIYLPICLVDYGFSRLQYIFVSLKQEIHSLLLN